MSVN
jgi:hypothetical protein